MRFHGFKCGSFSTLSTFRCVHLRNTNGYVALATPVAYARPFGEIGMRSTEDMPVNVLVEHKKIVTPSTGYRTAREPIVSARLLRDEEATPKRRDGQHQIKPFGKAIREKRHAFRY